MEVTHNPRLMATELSNLWVNYMNDSMVSCGLQYFKATSSDPDVLKLIEFALQITQNHLIAIKEIFTEESYPIPVGFGDQDVNLKAPPLYSDVFMLMYIFNMASYGLFAYGMALATAARADVLAYFEDSLQTTIELNRRVTEIALNKGVYSRGPYIDIPETAEFVYDKDFLGGLFADKRPLIAPEISNLVYNIRRNAIGKALIIGFSQTAEEDRVKKYFLRGRDLSQKQIDIFSNFLDEEYLTAPIQWDSEVTASTVSPFSDKLMMYHISALIASAIGQYGVSMSVSPRSDLAAMYVRQSAEVALYAEDGAKLMIERGWMEKPPQAIDREQLVHS
ncbi:MAG: hypothetical protein K0R75_3653 [Paenibacillaceae bacterium]|jgi:hypothetical protein|nr:hypothetical protein [Paenibacillaceae bacterium]